MTRQPTQSDLHWHLITGWRGSSPSPSKGLKGDSQLATEDPSSAADQSSLNLNIAYGQSSKRKAGLPWANRALTFKRNLHEQLHVQYPELQDERLARFLKYVLAFYG